MAGAREGELGAVGGGLSENEVEELLSVFKTEGTIFIRDASTEISIFIFKIQFFIDCLSVLLNFSRIFHIFSVQQTIFFTVRFLKVALDCFFLHSIFRLMDFLYPLLIFDTNEDIFIFPSCPNEKRYFDL